MAHGEPSTASSEKSELGLVDLAAGLLSKSDREGVAEVVMDGESVGGEDPKRDMLSNATGNRLSGKTDQHPVVFWFER
jgi:hypothetical protein